MNDRPSNAPGTLASPCVGICRLDRASQECLGCRRTLADIGAWRELDDAARQKVLDAAAARRAGHARSDAGTDQSRRSGGGIE